MKIDLAAREVTIVGPEGETRHPLASDEAFAALSEAWLLSGWANRYTYGFSWLGRPIIQLPEDLVRIQELVYRLKPAVIVETGVAHGGGQIFLAGLCRMMGRGRVIGIDIEIRSHNRAAIEAHELSSLITLIEGDSVAEEVVGQVGSLIAQDESVLVILDSDHTKGHVLAELEAYSRFVRPGGYVVVADGIMQRLVGMPGAKPDWDWNNPVSAVDEFLRRHEEFVLDIPSRPFDEAGSAVSVTHWPKGYLRRIG